MAIIFVIGPCWNNLNVLKNTIENNRKMVKDIKHFYITTNDNTVLEYFEKLNDENIKCQKFADNQGHQTSCFNAVISGMKMIIENDKDNDDDIVIFSHEDVYVKDINLFNNSLSKFNKGVDIVCRKYEGTKKGESLDYYMNDAFFIKKNKIKEIFGKKNMMTIHVGMFCENEFTKIISNYNICSFPYHDHSIHKDSELGFYHILNYNISNITFWDKSNINELFEM
jgi:hypothetical protein